MIMKNIIIYILLLQLVHVTLVNAQQDEYWIQSDHWLNSGDASLSQSEVEVALRNSDYYIETNPKDPIGYIRRARLYQVLGRQIESELDLRVAERLNPLSLMYANPTLRSKYTAKKSYEYNFEDLDNVFVKSPSRYEDYKKLFDDISIGHSQDSLIAKVIRELNNKNIEKAELLLSEIKVTDVNRALIYDLYGKIYLKKIDYGKAIELFSKAIESDPLFSIAYHNRSLCYKLIGDFDKAEKDLKSAIDLNDNISLFYFTYAKLNEEKGNKDKALDYYSKVLEIDADYKEALVNYSQLLKGLGEYEAGLMYLNEAINKNPENIENKFHKANTYFVYGNYVNAIKEYNDFLRSNPNDSDALFNIGLSKILMRNNKEGCRAIANSLEIEDSEKREKIYQMFCVSY